MAEYIEREAAIDAIMKVYVRTAGYKARERVFEAKEAVHRLPVADVEKMSDGYHTFADLYEQRLILSAALAKNNPRAWKSKRHEDGSVPFGGGWFIMGFDTDEGCYTYHYELKDWGLFQCKELERGKPWDGHTSKDVRRLLSIPAADVAPVVHGRWTAQCVVELDGGWTLEDVPYNEYQHSNPICSVCRKTALLDGGEDYVTSPYCPNCGAKMDGDSDALD